MEGKINRIFEFFVPKFIQIANWSILVLSYLCRYIPCFAWIEFKHNVSSRKNFKQLKETPCFLPFSTLIDWWVAIYLSYFYIIPKRFVISRMIRILWNFFKWDVSNFCVYVQKGFSLPFLKKKRLKAVQKLKV